jgi:drug/metabolite transporter (DMT)-like permease
MQKHAHLWPGVPAALVAAVLFGISTPLAKVLLGTVHPWMLAGLLYFGAGVGLGIVQLVRAVMGVVSEEAPLRRADLPWLAGIIACGGIAAPLLLALGLTRGSASGASLFLNLEGLATMCVAWLVFRENVDRRLLLGAAAILGGAVVLSWHGGQQFSGLAALCVAGACLGWGIDNNLSRKISSADPLQLTVIKGCVAGSINIVLALAFGEPLPGVMPALLAAVLGFFCYGVSLVAFIFALRHLGTARTSAYFSFAPFLGAALAIALFHESVSIRFIISGALMALGIWLHLAERHEHEHTHEDMEHEHAHVHDEHHQHEHSPNDPPGEPHTHRHRHKPLTHSHPHYPDLHHRHTH